MSRTIITGSGSDLIDALADKVTCWRNSDCFGEVIILTPDHCLQQSVNNELPLQMGIRHRSGLFNTTVTSLSRWAQQIVRRYSREKTTFLSPVASLAVVSDAIRQSHSETSALAGSSNITSSDPRERPSFQLALLAELINLKKAGYTPDTVPDHRYRDEVGAVYRASEAILHNSGSIDISDGLRCATEIIDEGRASSLSDLAGIILFGFGEFNYLEKEIIRAISECTERVAAFIPFLDGAPAYARTAQTVEFFSELWHTDPSPCTPKHDSAAAGVLEHVFTRNDQIIPEARVTLVSTPDRVLEWVHVARTILSMIQDDPGLRFSDIHVLSPHLDRVLPIVCDILDHAGIPVHLTGGSPFSESRTARSFMALIEVFESRLSRSSVMELLSTASVRSTGDISDSSIYEWDRISRLAGITGGRSGNIENEWIRPLELFVDRVNNQVEQSIEDNRTGSAEDYSVTPADLQADKVSAEALIEFIRTLSTECEKLEKAQRSESWREFSESLKCAVSRVLELSDNGETKQLEKILNQMNDLDELGLKLPPRAVLMRVIADTLAAEKTHITNSSSNAVWLGNLNQYGYWQPRVVIVTGLVDGEFPGEDRNTALTTVQRPSVRVSTHDGYDVELGHKAAEDYLCLALAMSAATDRVVLTYPRQERSDDTQRLPSTAFTEVLRVTRKSFTDENGAPLPWTESTIQACLDQTGSWIMRWPVHETPSDMADTFLNSDEYNLYWSGRFRSHESAADWLAALQGNAPHAYAMIQNRQNTDVPCDGMLQNPSFHEYLKHSLTTGSPLSASALETYAACPFQYFCRYVLKLDLLPEPEYAFELDALAVGTLIHELLKRVFSRLKERGTPILTMNREEMMELLFTVADEYHSDIEQRYALPSEMIWNTQWQDVLTRCQRAVEMALRDAPMWEPQQTEYSFGDTSRREKRVEIPVEGFGGIPLRGSIDRIDYSRTGNTVRIVDYKSGKKRDNAKDYIDAGRSIQLLLYAMILEDINTDNRVSEVCYQFLREPIEGRNAEDFCKITQGDELEEARQELREALRDIITGITQGVFPPYPEQPPSDHFQGECRYCDMAEVCGSLLDLTRRWRDMQQNNALEKLTALRKQAKTSKKDQI